MIADVLDLEQLLTQFESEAVLVGPLLSLSINTGYRYLYLAGNGRKVYQSIGLGFLENESHAQKKRADIIEKLKPRFAELVLFDSHTEMARAVHSRWRTEETARALAAVEREAKAASAPRADYETMSERGDEHTLRLLMFKKLMGGQLAAEPAAVPERTRTGNLTRQLFEDTGRDEAGTIRLPSATTLPRLTKECGETPARQNQRHLGLTQDNIASAILKLAAPAQPDNCPVSPVDPCRSLSASPAILEAEQCLTPSDSVPIMPIKHTRGRSTFLPLGPTFLLLAIVLFWTFVLPSTREGVDKVDNTQLAQVTNLPSKSAAAEPPLPMSQPANALGSAQQAEATPRTVPKAAAASRGESSGSNAALVSDRHEPIAQQERTADLSEAKAIAKLVDRGMESLKSGDLESARVSLQRAVQAIPGRAAVQSRVEPSRSTALRGTSQALAMEQPGPQNEHSPQIKSSSDARHSAQVVSLKPGVMPGSGQVAPAQKNSTIRQLDPNEIAILLSRGMKSLKSCNLESARVSLRRAIKAIPGTAAVPSSGPSRSMPLRGTSQALAMEQPGPQNEHSPRSKSSSDARHSAASPEPGVAPGSGQVAPAQKNSTIQQLDPDEIAILVSRGMDFLKSGDLASARVTLRRAAEAGNAEAALALGTTYDPSVLRQLGAVGIAADVAEAREWYEKAVKFGSAAAAQRLATLAQATR